MKKLFLTICFLVPFSANAELRSIANVSKTEQIASGLPDVNREEVFGNFDNKDWSEYLLNRIQKGLYAPISGPLNSNSSGASSVVPSQEELIAKNKQSPNLFEKMYQEAINRVIKKEDDKKTPQFATTKPLIVNQDPGFAAIGIEVPFIKKGLNVPAQPHIPFFFSNIEVLSSGDIFIEENIVLVNNTATAYSKVIPQSITNRNGIKQDLDVEVISVSINDSPIEYKKYQALNNFVLKPKEKLVLPAGVYEYKIKYHIKGNLSFYDNFDEFFFNISGSNRFVISRFGALVSYPPEFDIISSSVFSEFDSVLSSKSATVTEVSKNSFAYFTNKPLLMGDGFYINTAIKKGSIKPLGIMQKAANLIDAYASNLYALLGFVVIFIAYLISYKTIDKKSAKQNISLNKTPPMMRLLEKNKIDINSLMSFILDLYRKNILDIIKNDDVILLIKKTDKNPTLKKHEKLALDELFSNKESALSITSYNVLKLKRSLEKLQKGLKTSLRTFSYKLNSRYLAFSSAMLAVSLFAIATDKINIATSFFVYAVLSALFALFVFAFNIKTNKKYFDYIIKTTNLFAAIFIFLLFANFTNAFASFFVLLSVVTMFVFSHLFVKRSGLLQNYINESKDYKTFLEKNLETITSSKKDFTIQQANIFAFDLSSNIKNKDAIKDVYKLDLAQEIINSYNRKK